MMYVVIRYNKESGIPQRHYRVVQVFQLAGFADGDTIIYDSEGSPIHLPDERVDGVEFCYTPEYLSQQVIQAARWVLGFPQVDLDQKEAEDAKDKH